MPKGPVLSRELFYDKLRDGTFRDLDWALVNTTLGAMLEPRSIATVGSPVRQVDALDVSFTRRTQMDETVMFRTFGTAGPLVPVDFNA